jgi:Copper amine oxidase, enzyme domain
VYHNQTFPSPDSFLEAWKNGTLVRFPQPSLEPEAWDWASRIRPYTLNTTTASESSDPTLENSELGDGKKGDTKKGKHEKDTRRIQAPPRDLDHLPGPRQVSFAGKRFRVHEGQRHVTWMGWSFYTGFDRDMGVNLWDVRFKGERVVYQVCLHLCLLSPCILALGPFLSLPPLRLPLYLSQNHSLALPSLVNRSLMLATTAGTARSHCPICRCRPRAEYHRLAGPVLWHGRARSQLDPALRLSFRGGIFRR